MISLKELRETAEKLKSIGDVDVKVEPYVMIALIEALEIAIVALENNKRDYDLEGAGSSTIALSAIKKLVEI